MSCSTRSAACSTARRSSWARRWRRSSGEFAAYCEVPHALGVANGTEAIALALRAVGVGPGDTVAVAAGVHLHRHRRGGVSCRARGRCFVDIEPQTFTLDPAALRTGLLHAGPPVRAIIPVHLYGQVAAMDEITRRGEGGRGHGRRGRGASARRTLPRAPRRRSRLHRLLQFLPEQEPRRARRRRCDHHHRRRSGCAHRLRSCAITGSGRSTCTQSVGFTAGSTACRRRGCP